tara:strand:+ start:16146 stop:16958 length:813 start_codon:yes stop_codon:yes gene_type:complete
MKTTYTLLIFLWLMMPTTFYAQIGGSVFEVTNEAQKKAKGEADDAAEDAQDMEDFQRGLEEFSRPLLELSNEPMVGRCLEIMGSHAFSLAKEQTLIEETGDCTTKKDLLEAQTLLVLSGGTIMYCPEEFNSDRERYSFEILEYFNPVIQDIKEFMIKYREDNSDRPYQERVDEILRDMYGDAEESDAALEKKLRIILKFKYAEEKFGNPNDIQNLLTAAGFHGYSNKQSSEKEGLDFYKVIDYFSYYLSPEFMSLRVQQIEALRKGLPCA